MYQRYGLMDHGSVWGHGSLRGMDFSAQTLHLLGESLRSYYADKRFGKSYGGLTREQAAVVDVLVLDEIKQNTYDAATGELRISEAKAHGLAAVRQYWDEVMGEGGQGARVSA